MPYSDNNSDKNDVMWVPVGDEYDVSADTMLTNLQRAFQ